MFSKKAISFKSKSENVFLLFGIFTLALILSCEVHAQTLNINSGTIIQITQAEGEMDEAICENGVAKCEGTEYNPVCLFTDSTGSIATAAGSKVEIRNNEFAYVDNDMIVNAGDQAITILGVILQKGEYGIVKNGQLDKSSGNLLSDTEMSSEE